MDNKELGKRIRELRKSRNLKQDDLALALNLSRGQISNIETGKRSVSLSQIQKLCSLFKIDMAFLGIEPDTEETIQLLERAKLVFSSDSISDEEKEALYGELMKVYLTFKGTI